MHAVYARLRMQVCIAKCLANVSCACVINEHLMGRQLTVTAAAEGGKVERKKQYA